MDTFSPLCPTTMPAPPAPKTGYAAGAALRPFFTGAAARLSPDGSCLAATCGAEAHVVDSRGGGLLAVLEGDSEPLTALAFGCGASLHALWPPHASQAGQQDVIHGQPEHAVPAVGAGGGGGRGGCGG